MTTPTSDLAPLGIQLFDDPGAGLGLSPIGGHGTPAFRMFREGAGLSDDDSNHAVGGGATLATGDLTPTIRVLLSDLGAVSGDQVRLIVDGQADRAIVLSEADVANGHIDLTADALSEGVHLIAARAMGASGAEGKMSAILPLRVDVTAPKVTLNTVANLDGETVGDGGVTADHVLVFKFEVDDHGEAASSRVGPAAGHDIYSSLGAGMRVELYANGVIVGETDVSVLRPDGQMQIQTGELSAGHYVFTLIAMDDAGNVGFTATPFGVDVSETHPDHSPHVAASSLVSGWVFEV